MELGHDCDDIMRNLLELAVSQYGESRSEQLKKDYPDVDWKNEKVTSAVFDYWKVQGDFLCIYLIGKNKPIIKGPIIVLKKTLNSFLYKVII